MNDLNTDSIILITDDKKELIIENKDKHILSQRSEYFGQLLFGWSDDCRQRQIHLRDTSGHALAFLIDFLITDICDFRCLADTQVMQIIRLSHRLNCEPLLRKCIEMLCKLIHYKNVFDIYLFNRLYELKTNELTVDEYCLQYISNFANHVFNSDLFLELNYNNFCEIVERIPQSNYELIIKESIQRWIQSNYRESIQYFKRFS